MNKYCHLSKQESDILLSLFQKSFVNQRILAENSGCSLGIVNRSVKNLIANGFLDEDIHPTKKAKKQVLAHSPRNAVILAAGCGMRMVPINMEVPKGLLEVKGEPLIERLIRQLHEVNITEIYVVVGFMKEQYEYLIDEYGIELIVNADYSVKNNIHSLKKALSHLSDTYIVPCDIWCRQNPFGRYELYSWYMVSNLMDTDSDVRVNRKMELVSVPENSVGNTMVGICYLVETDARIVGSKIKELCSSAINDDLFWEAALYKNNKMTVMARVIEGNGVVEINTYEQLRELDSDSGQLKTEALEVISQVLGVENQKIEHIAVLKKGMTNRSFCFSAGDEKYIMRIPGEGTDQLIDREQEAAVYQAIAGKEFCDDPVYIDSKRGYKITKFLNDVRPCDPNNRNDLKKCMRVLHELHNRKLRVEHDFDIFDQIEFYETLWNGRPSMYRDYAITKKNVFSLRNYIESQVKEKCLTHIDAVPDNFLFYKRDEKEKIQLVDWEYAGMQDPHVDIAMFCIYSLYSKEQVDQLIRIYFQEAADPSMQCSTAVRTKIYCYMAACGLLWSNWCEYKSQLGIEFGEYSLRQYRFAKEYYRYAAEEIRKAGIGEECDV